MKPTPARLAATLPAVALLVAFTAAGCSGGNGGNDSAGSDAGGSVAANESVPSANRAADSVLGRTGGRPQPVVAKGSPNPVTPQQALIRTGSVELRAHDVGKAQFEVQRVVDRFGGQVTQEQTTTGDDGKPAYTRMVLRTPSTDFDTAMRALKGIAELETANTGQEDVTTELIDVRTRVRVQKRSIARITTLFDRAQSIRDIMAIEAQLSRRQADLDSLERRLAYLTDQTSLSTITVSIDRIPPRRAAAKDDSGFLAGLSAGWHGLTASAVALATALGALLPWLVVLLVLGPPALLVIRAVRRRISGGRSGRTPSAA